MKNIGIWLLNFVLIWIGFIALSYILSPIYSALADDWVMISISTLTLTVCVYFLVRKYHTKGI